MSVRKAVLNGSNLVVNVVALPDGWTGGAGQWQPPGGTTVVDALDANVGDTWTGSEFDKPPEPQSPPDPAAEQRAGELADLAAAVEAAETLADVKAAVTKLLDFVT